MQIDIRTLLLLFTLTLISCSKEEQNSFPDTPSSVTVTIGSTPRLDIESRATLDPDGMTVNWTKGDKIAVWARGEDGEYQFAAQPFILWHFGQTFGEAKFTATIAPMPEGKYDYFSAVPLPESIDSIWAGYSIPAVQTGVYSDQYDIRVATPSLGKAPLTEGDNSASVSFSFAHKVHMLRIRVPENQLGEPITELELTFPVAVAGKLTVDVTDPAKAPILAEEGGSHTLRIRPQTPLQAGDVVMAMIAPMEISNTERIEIRAYGETCAALPAYMPGKNFAAGRITPIALTIPAKERDFASIELSLTDLGEATLGENINLFKISGPYNCDLGNGSSERIFDVKQADEKYVFFLGPRFSADADNISGQTFKVTYESVNAAVTNSFVMPQLTDSQRTAVDPLTVPYLLDEDFSAVQAFDYNGSDDSHQEALHALDGLANGWTGNHIQSQEGTSIRVKNRRETSAISTVSTYRGRVNSPQLSGIKPGRTVKLSISFNYSSTSGNTNFTPILNFGYETKPGSFAGYWKSGFSGGGAQISNRLIDNLSISKTGGSFTDITNSATATIDNATRDVSLSWDIDASGSTRSTKANLWLYLDNIRVTIVK